MAPRLSPRCESADPMSKPPELFVAALTEPPFPSHPGPNAIKQARADWIEPPFLFVVPYLNKHAGGSEGLIGPSLGKVGEGRERRRRGEGEVGPGELITLTQRTH